MCKQEVICWTVTVTHNDSECLTSIKVYGLYVVQREVLKKVIADLKDKIKNHPLDVKSLELNSKLRVDVFYCFK